MTDYSLGSQADLYNKVSESRFLSFVIVVFSLSEQRARGTASKQRDGVHCVQGSANNTGARLLLAAFFVFVVFAGKGVLTGIFWKNREKRWKEK